MGNLMQEKTCIPFDFDIQGVTLGIADQQKSEIVNKNSAIPLW